MPWPVVYYRDSHGREPVDDFLNQLPVKAQVVLDNQIDRLVIFGAALPFPHSSQIEGELRELRCHYGSDLYRILYARSNNLFVLLHAVSKRTGQVPTADIVSAHARLADFKRRMNESPRRPPRAAGHDAP